VVFTPQGDWSPFQCILRVLIHPPSRPVDPTAYGDPYGDRPASVVSNSTNGVESAWRRRQTIKRGVTRKVKLTQGNFITEYPVPTPVLSAIEAKYTATKTTEFSLVHFLMTLFSMVKGRSTVI